MKKLQFTYEMTIQYSAPVTCFYTIRCVPKTTKRQELLSCKIHMEPASPYESGTDGFSNLQIHGAIREPHDFFLFRLEGEALTGISSYEEVLDPDEELLYRNPHGMNAAGPRIREFSESIRISPDAGPQPIAEGIMHALHAAFRYQKKVTDVRTSAEEAFAQGSGVCQDYAHIMIALLHERKIPARYVTGFIIGEGESHAWVEYLCDGLWIPIDPTNDRIVDADYLKIGHGRDSSDCAINRGIVKGAGSQEQHVRVFMCEAQE